MQLDSKVIAITGGSRGLGKALAIQCCERGAKVAILGRNTQQLEQAVDDIGGEISGIGCDIGDPDSVRSAFSEIFDQFGTLDALVNNAAIYPPFRVEKASDQQLRSIIDTNVLGAMYCCREAIPLLKRSRGDIINVSSEAVRFHPPMLSVYAASKAALETFSQSLRVELAGQGVRVSAMRVGHIHRVDDSPLDDETLAEMMQVFEETGFAAATGEGMAIDTVTTALMQLLTLPADATMDLLELRSRN